MDISLRDHEIIEKINQYCVEINEAHAVFQ